MKKSKHTIGGWLEEYGDPEISKFVEVELEKQRLKSLTDVAEYLGHKYDCKISFDTDKEQFEITGLGEEKEAGLLNDFKEIGL